MKYFVSTRNWNCKQNIKKILNLSLKIGACRDDYYMDGDSVYYMETNSQLKAWVVFLYYKLLQKWSNGMTFMIKRKKNVYKTYGDIKF